MKVIYKKTVKSEVDEAIALANESKQTIDRIILGEEEFERFYFELSGKDLSYRKSLGLDLDSPFKYEGIYIEVEDEDGGDEVEDESPTCYGFTLGDEASEEAIAKMISSIFGHFEED